MVAAAWMGKLKTLAQAVALSFALLPLWTLMPDSPIWVTFLWINIVTMWIAVILTIASGIDYVATELRAARRARKSGEPHDRPATALVR